MRTTELTKYLAGEVATQAIVADERHDAAERDRHIRELWDHIGYWLRPRNPSAAEYRGESLPPRMLRMPPGNGASVPWSRRWKAVVAWAEYHTNQE